MKFVPQRLRVIIQIDSRLDPFNLNVVRGTLVSIISRPHSLSKLLLLIILVIFAVRVSSLIHPLDLLTFAIRWILLSSFDRWAWRFGPTFLSILAFSLNYHLLSGTNDGAWLSSLFWSGICKKLLIVDICSLDYLWLRLDHLLVGALFLA